MNGHTVVATAYCIPCKTRREYMAEVKRGESGRRTAEGTCPECREPMSRVMGKDA